MGIIIFFLDGKCLEGPSSACYTNLGIPLGGNPRAAPFWYPVVQKYLGVYIIGKFILSPWLGSSPSFNLVYLVFHFCVFHSFKFH